MNEPRAKWKVSPVFPGRNGTPLQGNTFWATKQETAERHFTRLLKTAIAGGYAVEVRRGA